MFGSLSSRSSELNALIQLGKQPPPPNPAQRQNVDKAFMRQVYQFFGKALGRPVTVASQLSQLDETTLRQTTLIELCNLIRKLADQDTPFFLKSADKVVTQLLEACVWKVLSRKLILADRMAIGRAAEMAKKDWKQGILNWLTPSLGWGKQQYIGRLLTDLTPADREAIAYRTIRAVVAMSARSQKPLFLLHQQQIVLDVNIARPYLLDQIPLYVYLFKNKNEVLFLTEALAKLKRWVIGQLERNPTVVEPEAKAAEMMSRIQEAFLRKYDDQRNPQKLFYLDASLTTYLSSFLHTDKSIEKALDEQRPYPETDTLNEDDEGLNQLFIAHGQDDWESQWEIIQYCKKMLSDTCRELIDMRYDNQYGDILSMESIALRVGKKIGALYDQMEGCLNKLRLFVHTMCKERNLNFLPR